MSTITDGDGEFRRLVEKLVAQVMPDELNNIDELIEEYVGREEELLLTLNGMRDGEDPPELPEDFANFDDPDINAGADADDDDFAGDTVVIDVDDGEESLLPTVAVVDDGNEKQEVVTEVINDEEMNVVDIENNAGELSTGAAVVSPITNLPPNDGPSDIPGVISAASTGASHSTQMTNNTKEKHEAGGGRILFPAHEVTDHGDGDDMTLSTLGNGTVGGKVNRRSAPPSSALRGSGSMENSTTEDNNRRKKKKKQREPLSNRAWCIIFTVVIVLIVIVAIILGVILGTRNSKSNNDNASKEGSNNGNQDGEFIGQIDIPKNNDGAFIKDTPPPTPSPATTNYNNKHNDGYNPNDSMSFCNILPPENIQELGITKLQGTYPKVAIDGTQAIVASGSGFVAFYEFNDLRRVWSRTEVFNLPTNVGEISSVAISGNVAVAGAPMSMTDLSEYRDEPLETGAIYIYERDPSGSDAIMSDKWQQFESEVYIPEEYKRSNSVRQYREARFGWSVDIDGDLIVVGAPEENNNKGSATVFRRKDVSNAGGALGDGSNQKWEQVRRILPNDLCVAEFFAYSVQVNNDLIAASADCDVILLLYQYDRNSATLALTQEMRYVSPKWGTISSISMGWDNLVYSTVNGGLFIYRRGKRADGTTWYTLEQKMSFDNTPTLFQYPLTVDTTMMSLAAADKVYIYTQDERSRRWKRENIVLTAAGDYTGYIGASVAMSGGHLLIAEKKEVKTHDFTSCAQTESMAPTPNPSKAPTVQPTVSPGSPTCIRVNLIFDDNSAETSWEIKASDGLSAAKSPVFDELMQDISSPVCLPDGNYAFTIADVAGDGMCCDSGQGSYSVTSAKGEVITRGGDFDFQETIQFTMPYNPELPFNPELQVATPAVTKTAPSAPKPVPVSVPIPATARPTLKQTSAPIAPATTPPTRKPVAAVTPAPTPKPVTPPPTPKPTVAAPDCYTLDVKVVLDQYPDDTIWDIIPQGSGVPFYNSIPYDMSLAYQPTTQSICLPEGMYDFTIYDGYGDGICCEWGTGSYELSFDGNVVVNGGSFGFNETKTFSTPTQ